MKQLYNALLLLPLFAIAQPDHIYMPTIHTVKLFKKNDQESIPIIRLNSPDQLELHFDDLDEDIKSYSYTYQLCNADWQPSDLSSFEYIKGFQQQRISTYRVSSITQCKYIHYEAMLPDADCKLIMSGNYLLKVFLDSDTSQLAFTKRIFVLNSKTGIFCNVTQPIDNQLLQTHQKLKFNIDITQLNAPNPVQQMKVVVAQNYKWDDAITNLQPTFIRENVLEYSGEQDCLFEGGKEYRWADLRSFRFMSSRIERIDKSTDPNSVATVYLRPDRNTNGTQYLYYRDNNGWMDISTSESVNPWWQSDYANVIFTYIPDGHQPLAGKDIYLVGEMTQNVFNDNSKMEYNPEKGIYQKKLLLKHGYYSYAYATKDIENPQALASPAATEGNYWETENDYTIFVYYQSYTARHDELVGVSVVNSRTNRVGF